MASDGLQYGYCKYCNKEVPIVAGMLEPHQAMAAARDMYGKDAATVAECDGSMCEPSPMPEGDVERFRFHDTAPVADHSDKSALMSAVRQYIERTAGSMSNVRRACEGLRLSSYAYGGVVTPRVEINGVDISEHISGMQINQAIEAQPAETQSEWREAFRNTMAEMVAADAAFDRQVLDDYISSETIPPTPLGARPAAWGGIEWPDDPAVALTAAGVRIDDPVYVQVEYADPDDMIDFMNGYSLRIRATKYRISQRDSEPIDVTALIQHYQGRISLRDIAGEFYLSFS